MPLFNDLEGPEQRRVINGINRRIDALREARSKLAARRDTVQNLTRDELLLIELERVRMNAKINDLVDEREAFKMNTASIDPPTDAQIEAMKQRVERIREINVSERTTRQIVLAAVNAAGELRDVGLA